jgi:hypothetical protein
VLDDSLVNNMISSGVDYASVPMSGRSGGILLARHMDRWVGTNIHCTDHMVTIRMASAASPSSPWWLMTVYVLLCDQDKASFLQELRTVRSGCVGA